MVSDDRDVVSDEVAHVAGFVFRASVDEIEVVCRRLPLEDVSSVDENCASRQPSDLLRHEPVDSLQAAFSPAVVPEVVWEVVPMDVGCKNDVDLTSFHFDICIFVQIYVFFPVFRWKGSCFSER